jgi:hypothetical protein
MAAQCGRVLTVANYHDTGGIWQAVTQQAEGVHGALDAAAQDAAQRMLVRMVRLGEGTEDVRRRISLAELLAGCPADEAAAITRAKDALVEARLITVADDSAEITHEALIRAWPRLRQWISQDRPGNLSRQELDEAATAWDHHRSETSALYRVAAWKPPAHGPATTIWTSAPRPGFSWPLQVGSNAAPRCCAGALSLPSLRWHWSPPQRSSLLPLRARPPFGNVTSAIYNQTIAEALQLGSGGDTSLAAQLKTPSNGSALQPATTSRPSSGTSTSPRCHTTHPAHIKLDPLAQAVRW